MVSRCIPLPDHRHVHLLFLLESSGAQGWWVRASAVDAELVWVCWTRWASWLGLKAVKESGR